jgi:hypothetical protein
MRTELSTEAQQAAAFDVAREVARPALERGLATLEQVDPPPELGNPLWLALRPVNPAACPVEIAVDCRRIDLLVTEHGICHEIWDKDDERRLEELRECLQAVVAGRFEGNLKIRPRRLFSHKYVGTFHTASGDITVVHYSRGSLDYGPPGRTVYQPYVTQE